jgi:GNAT superfamily N-acetyltransferase
MQISHIKYFQNWIPIIAKWIYEEWAYVNPHLTLQDIQKSLIGRVKENELPITLVAHDERGVLGTASLKGADMDILQELTPWLSSVYVHPDYRGQGIARALSEEIDKAARQLGHRQIYVFNHISQGIFEKLGWRILQTVEYGGKELAILVKDLGSAP